MSAPSGNWRATVASITARRRPIAWRRIGAAPSITESPTSRTRRRFAARASSAGVGGSGSTTGVVVWAAEATSVRPGTLGVVRGSSATRSTSATKAAVTPDSAATRTRLSSRPRARPIASQLPRRPALRIGLSTYVYESAAAPTVRPRRSSTSGGPSSGMSTFGRVSITTGQCQR